MVNFGHQNERWHGWKTLRAITVLFLTILLIPTPSNWCKKKGLSCSDIAPRVFKKKYDPKSALNSDFLYVNFHDHLDQNKLHPWIWFCSKKVFYQPINKVTILFVIYFCQCQCKCLIITIKQLCWLNIWFCHKHDRTKMLPGLPESPFIIIFKTTHWRRWYR